MLQVGKRGHGERHSEGIAPAAPSRHQDRACCAGRREQREKQRAARDAKMPFQLEDREEER